MYTVRFILLVWFARSFSLAFSVIVVHFLVRYACFDEWTEKFPPHNSIDFDFFTFHFIHFTRFPLSLSVDLTVKRKTFPLPERKCIRTKERQFWFLLLLVYFFRYLCLLLFVFNSCEIIFFLHFVSRPSSLSAQIQIQQKVGRKKGINRQQTLTLSILESHEQSRREQTITAYFYFILFSALWKPRTNISCSCFCCCRHVRTSKLAVENVFWAGARCFFFYSLDALSLFRFCLVVWNKIHWNFAM